MIEYQNLGLGVGAIVVGYLITRLSTKHMFWLLVLLVSICTVALALKGDYQSAALLLLPLTIGLVGVLKKPKAQ